MYDGDLRKKGMRDALLQSAFDLLYAVSQTTTLAHQEL
jgi:hypothetical protein